MVLLDRPSPSAEEPVSTEVEALKRAYNFRPGELVRLLNSTPLGDVVSERQLSLHRRRAKLSLGEARRVNLLVYIAWLAHQRPMRGGRPRGKVGPKEVYRLLQYQGFRCALTNRRLTPKSAALDHIHPVSRGGEHQIENAQVLDKDVNRAKGTLTNAEFIQLCREVAAHADHCCDTNFQSGEGA
jgi:5-methylcytosine-specific restriction endonuclease McrA